MAVEFGIAVHDVISQGSISPTLNGPVIMRSVKKHHDLPLETFASPVIASVSIIPPVAGQPFRAHRARDGNAPTAPGHHARRITIAQHFHCFRWVKRSARHGGQWWRRRGGIGTKRPDIRRWW